MAGSRLHSVIPYVSTVDCSEQAMTDIGLELTRIHSRLGCTGKLGSLLVRLAHAIRRIPTLALVVWLCLGGSVGAQQIGQPMSGGETPISQFVPASSGLYVHVTQLGAVNEALHRVNAWRWLPYLFSVSGEMELPSDLFQGMARMMGTTEQNAERDLRGAEVGIAASSLSSLDQAVWFVRVPDREAADRWFPSDRRTAQADFGIARSFRTNDGIIACERGGILALARWFKSDSLALTTMYLMRGRSEPVLHDLPLVQRSRGYFPSNPLATVYVPGQSPINPRRGSAGEEVSNQGTNEAPSKELVAALYEAENGLDVALRREADPGSKQPNIAPEVIERLLQLPRSTLFAAAWGVDWSALARFNPPNAKAGWVSRYITYMLQPHAANENPADAFQGIGSSVILAWDQDLGGSTGVPQMALLLQAESSEVTKSTIERAAGRLIRLAQILNPSDLGKPVDVSVTTHLGTSVSCTPLREYMGAPRHALARLLSGVELCWADSGAWFVVTLSRDHMERILDAQNGLTPSLGSMREASTLRGRRSSLRLVALFQGGLAAGELDAWMKDADSQNSFLSSTLWRDLTRQRAAPRQRIGLGIRAEGLSGSVLIGRVYPDTAADGLFEAGDRIIGVNGELLSMTDPNGDLRQRLAQSTATPGPTIRVLRGDELKDIVLPIESGGVSNDAPTMMPADAVREIASLIRPLPFASLVVGATDDHHYSARASLRFATEATTLQIPPE